MPSDTTRTATDAAPAVITPYQRALLDEMRDNVNVSPLETLDWRTCIITIADILLSLPFAVPPESADTVRALREQLQKAEAERDKLTFTADVLGSTIASYEQDVTRLEQELQQERDAHAQTKMALELEKLRADALQKHSERLGGRAQTAEAKLRTAQQEQQELQQARGLIEELDSALSTLNSHSASFDVFRDDVGLAVLNIVHEALARADAFLAGTMAEAAPGSADVPEALHCCQCGGEYTAARDIRVRSYDQNGDAYMLCIYCAPLKQADPAPP